MRKFSLFLATIMMLVMANMPMYASSQIQGDGSSENPFLIENISQLSIINDFPDMCFKLINDIDFSNCSWVTVGTQGENFSGIFDGNNHRFLNTKSVIFQTNNGEIRNLLIENATSMLVDTNKGIIKNCGIIGSCKCYSSFGLIAYYNYKNAVIDSCYSKGSITASIVGSSGDVGGICGFNNGTIRNCYSGVAISGKVSSSYSYYGNTQIASDGTMMIGNIVGRNAGAVEKCFGYGNITYSVGSHYSGAHEDIYCGGLIGYTEGSVSDSYFNSDEVICNNTGIGSPKTTLGLKIRSTYENWDFENTWAIDPDYNDGYPYLRWERASNLEPSQDELTEEQEATSLAIVDAKCTDDSIKLISHVNINSNDTPSAFGTIFIPLWLFNSPDAQTANVEYNVSENPIVSGDTFGTTLNNIPDGYQDMFFVGKSYIRLDDSTVIWSKAKKVSIDSPTLRKVAE